MKHLDDTSNRTPDGPQGLAGGSPTPHAEQAMAARRRLLLRAAASSAPVVMGLIPGTGQAASSAFRLADADAQRTPAGYIPAGGTDDAKWLRVDAKTYKIVDADNGKDISNYTSLFYVNNKYYQWTTSTAAGVDVTSTVVSMLAETKGNGASTKLAYARVETGSVLVLRLFDECSLSDSGKVWPEASTVGTTLQGLTVSAWTSVAGFTRSCNFNLSGS